jgi:hypothetical protein
MSRITTADKALLKIAFCRIDVTAMATATGTVVGLLLFLATAVLLAKGAPPGVEVGPHLELLGIYLPGYTVTWLGALLGAVYGLLLGAAVGAIIAGMWNFTHYLYMTAMMIRASWMRMMVD